MASVGAVVGACDATVVADGVVVGRVGCADAEGVTATGVWLLVARSAATTRRTSTARTIAAARVCGRIQLLRIRDRLSARNEPRRSTARPHG
jgi:hypothetical protein